MTELRKQFKKEHPETISETDKAFDDSNYIDWLEARLEALKQGQLLPIDSVSNCSHPFKEVAGAFCNKCKKYL